MTRRRTAVLIAASIWAATWTAAPPVVSSALLPPHAPLDVAAQNAIVAEYCATCHTTGRKPGGVVLQNFDAAALADNAELGERMILKLRAGMMPPSGSKRPDAAAIDALAAAFETRLDAPLRPGHRPRSGWRPLSRLNRAEFARAVRDVTGVHVDPAAYLPPDSISDGFDNIADVQSFSPALMTGYLRAAAAISRRAIADRSPAVFICQPLAAPKDEACADRILARLTASALRGAETANDLADLRQFYRDGRDGAGTDNGLRLALQALLVHPRFLLRVERAPDANGALDGLAIASRLSFFLWGAAPDAALLASARRGGLDTAAGRSRDVARLLRDRRSEALATRFASQWLRLQDLETLTPDPKLYPRFDASLARSMRRETELFFDSVVREDRSVLTLFDADYTFIDGRLAELYGLDAGRAFSPGAAFRRVTVPDARRGLLGQASILASTSVADRTSPVLRGKWVLEVFLGTPPPPPPPNVPALDDSVKAVRNGTPLSTRQRIEEHRRNPACASCHKVIDPIGLSLERFDAIGAWRSIDNGVEIDSTTELYDGQAVDGPVGLRRALLRRQDVLLRTFAARLLTYAVGRRLDHRDMPAVRAIVRSAGSRQYRLSAFVDAVVNSAAFTHAEAR